MKECSKCFLTREKNLFSRCKKVKDGLCAMCKVCTKQYRKINALSISLRKKIYNKVNALRISKSAKQYKEAHKEQIKLQRKEYRRIDYLKLKETHKKWRTNNFDRYALQRKLYISNNKEKNAIMHQKYRRNNKGKINARTSKRRAYRIRATPNWLSKNQIVEMQQTYIEATRLTQLTKIQYEVDHIIPLKGKTACGLHVPLNLQILTKKENILKSNNLTNI